MPYFLCYIWGTYLVSDNDLSFCRLWTTTQMLMWIASCGHWQVCALNINIHQISIKQKVRCTNFIILPPQISINSYKANYFGQTQVVYQVAVFLAHTIYHIGLNTLIPLPSPISLIASLMSVYSCCSFEQIERLFWKCFKYQENRRKCQRHAHRLNVPSAVPAHDITRLNKL